MLPRRFSGTWTSPRSAIHHWRLRHRLSWRERLGLAGSACPAECPLRHRSIVNIKDFGRAGFADRQFIIEGVTIMAVSLCARVVLPMPEESFGGHDMRVAPVPMPPLLMRLINKLWS